MLQKLMNLFVTSALLAVCPAWAASLTPGLVDGLRHGGYVLVVRHASSPTSLPTKSAADAENVALERQLDAKGRQTAVAMGKAFRSLHIPVGKVYSSPTYRARETIRLAAFGSPESVPELGDQGHSMARLNGPGPAAWLKAKVAEKPAPGHNTILVTHMPNIAEAFPEHATGLQDGETLVFKPDGRGHTAFVAQIPIEDWDKPTH